MSEAIGSQYSEASGYVGSQEEGTCLCRGKEGRKESLEGACELHLSL